MSEFMDFYLEHGIWIILISFALVTAIGTLMTSNFNMGLKFGIISNCFWIIFNCISI